MMNRGLMKRQMFARGGPVRMQQGGLAGISSSLQNANRSLGSAQQQLQQAIGGGGVMPSPLGGIMGAMPQQRRPMIGDKTMAEVVGNPMGTIGAIQNRLATPDQVAAPIGMKEGGAAFPDLTGDGKVTQADILKGRGVELAMGGDPMMAQQAAMMQAQMPQDPSMESATAEATKMGINPSDVEGMLNKVSEGIGNLDDAEDFEQVINSMRGDEAPISERYGELAELVGEEDAKATPESVLTLVQPIVQIAQIDQGIGGLAQEEMSAPVEGNMAGGIMSTVNMGEEVPAPVNFNQGGPVVAMAPGGVVERATTLQPGFQEMFANILGTSEDRQAEFDEQKKLTQAQMLFDIANTALAFATPGQRQMSPAERLASVTQETQLFDKIGARSQSLQDLKTKQKEAQRQLDLAATQAALSEASAQTRAEEALAAAREARDAESIGDDIFEITITTKDGKTSTTTGPMTQGRLNQLYKEHGRENVQIKQIFKPSGTIKSAENFMLADGTQVAAIPGTALYNSIVDSGALRVGNITQESLLKRSVDRSQVTLTADITIGGITYPAGSSPNFSANELDAISKTYGADAYTAYVAPISDKDYFTRYGMTKDQFESLKPEQKAYLQGLGVGDRDYFQKFGVDRNTFESYDIETKQILLNIEPKYRFETLTGDDGSVTIVRINERTNETVDVLDRDVSVTPSYFRVTMPNERGNPISRVVDIKTPEGKEVVANVNRMNAVNPGSATMFKLGTEDVNPRGFYVPGTEDYDGGVYTSYDGGRTFTDSNGTLRQIPTDSFEVSNTIAYEVNRNARISAGAQEQLDKIDNELITNITDQNGNPISKREKGKLRDALREARLGTGFWSKVYAGIDGLLGGTIAPEYFSEMFKDRQDARQYVEMVRVFGRSALSASPRFAVADLETTAQLFPDERAFFRNPVTEARKLSRLAEELAVEKRRILTLRASGAPIDKALNSTLSQKLFEIERLEGLLGPILTLSQTASAADLEKAQKIMDEATTRE